MGSLDSFNSIDSIRLIIIHLLDWVSFAQLTGSGAGETPIQPIRVRHEEALRGLAGGIDNTALDLIDVVDVDHIDHIIGGHSNHAGRSNQQQQ